MPTVRIADERRRRSATNRDPGAHSALDIGGSRTDLGRSLPLLLALPRHPRNDGTVNSNRTYSPSATELVVVTISIRLLAGSEAGQAIDLEGPVHHLVEPEVPLHESWSFDLGAFHPSRIVQDRDDRIRQSLWRTISH